MSPEFLFLRFYMWNVATTKFQVYTRIDKKDKRNFSDHFKITDRPWQCILDDFTYMHDDHSSFRTVKNPCQLSTIFWTNVWVWSIIQWFHHFSDDQWLSVDNGIKQRDGNESDTDDDGTSDGYSCTCQLRAYFGDFSYKIIA